MNGLLIRVGIDSSKKSGKWNAPCSKDKRFCYVPILEEGNSRGPSFDRLYSEFKPYARALGVEWPSHLTGNRRCHLDPDFEHSTYGDRKGRGKRIREILAPGDFIIFWSGLRSVESGKIICSIIGYYVISYIVNATDVGRPDWHRNAHTRRTPKLDDPDDIVVFANPELSGRLRKFIKIGEYREGAQRIDKILLDKWGPLCKKDGNKIKNGYIQRSGTLPIFGKPEKFQKWFKKQNPELIHANNI